MKQAAGRQMCWVFIMGLFRKTNNIHWVWGGRLWPSSYLISQSKGLFKLICDTGLHMKLPEQHHSSVSSKDDSSHSKSHQICKTLCASELLYTGSQLSREHPNADNLNSGCFQPHQSRKLLLDNQGYYWTVFPFYNFFTHDQTLSLFSSPSPSLSLSLSLSFFFHSCKILQLKLQSLEPTRLAVAALSFITLLCK